MPTLNSDGSASDTNTQIAAAASGDTVLLPSAGSFGWTIAVALPDTKYITLDLNGSTITLSGVSGVFTINAHASGNNRITNGTVIKSGTSYADFQGPFKINDARGSAGVRVDHINFSGEGQANADAVFIDMNGQGPGVMDHCTFTTMEWANEFIHINGWGAGDDTGWTNDTGDSLAGSGNIFYFEDNTFTQSSSQSGVSWLQGYYGCRAAFRYNTFDHVSVDMHGTAGNIGARWWEFYNNTWQNTVSGTGSSPAMNMRAGSGVCHDNTATGSGYGKSIQLCEEDSGYPADYQIGRGLNQALDPARVWSNTGISLEPDACDAPEVAGMVELDRDVYASARPGYTAYTYPHPLQGGGGGSVDHGPGHKRGNLGRRM
jgi:hypothetical protein